MVFSFNFPLVSHYFLTKLYILNKPHHISNVEYTLGALCSYLVIMSFSVPEFSLANSHPFLELLIKSHPLSRELQIPTPFRKSVRPGCLQLGLKGRQVINP